MIDLSHLLAATNGHLTGPPIADQFTDFAYDSRRLKPGQLFIAVQTATGDGHDYIPEAIERGATGILCQQAASYPVTTIIVPHTRQALLDYARYILRHYQPHVIGVTGSNGKTTTKEAVATVLSQRFNVFKNFGSYNGRYGLPIALGQLTAGVELAVLEMACDSFGEIAELAALASPQVGVVTLVSPVHLASLGSVENIALEKGALIASLPVNGTAILNSDDARVAQMSQRTSARVITYGFNPAADIRASAIKVTSTGTHFTMHHQNQTYVAFTQLIGRHLVYPLLAAVAVGLLYDIPVETALASLTDLTSPPGRLYPLPGQHGAMLIDDTFNASPASMRAAIDTLAALIAPDLATLTPVSSSDNHHFTQTIAVLGQMADLGEASTASHANLGAYLVDKVDRLIAFGEAGQTIAQGAIAAGFPIEAVQITYTPSDAVQAIKPHLTPHTVVLFKGSAEARLERVVRRLLAEPKRDRPKLARAEAEWEHVRLGLPDRPTWVELDLEALGHNTRTLADLARPAHLMAVLKADAYGHGAIKAARTTLSNGATWIGVATLGEALSLRRAGIKAPMLVLGYLPAWQANDAIRHDIRATVFTTSVLEAFSEAAQRLQRPAKIHIKIDTGMGRLGLLPAEAVSFVREAQRPGIILEGIFTHFGRADESDLGAAQDQLARFQTILTTLTATGLRPPLVHAANTAGLLNLPQAHFDLVRSGIGLYGLSPSPHAPLPASMRPVLSFKTTIGQVKQLPPDSPIGYGAAYCTQTTETIAIIPVGYADGFRRAPHTWPAVLVKGQRASLVGRVSMDQAAINVSHIPNVRQGDEVVLIGQQGSAHLTAEEVAASLGTINYEVISQILARVPRIH